MQSGARATVIIMLLVFLAVAAGFEVFFVGFHRIFFEGDTWLFRYSDTFIRLYPEMFWRDIFILLAGINLFLAGIFEYAGRAGSCDKALSDPCCFITGNLTGMFHIISIIEEFGEVWIIKDSTGKK